MPKNSDFNSTFTQLKEIFAPYEPKMDVAQNTSNMYILNTRYLLKKNYPLMFGGVPASLLARLRLTCPEIVTAEPDL